MQEIQYVIEGDGRKSLAVNVICTFCKTEFLRARRFANKSSIKFCSTECKKQYDKEIRYENVIIDIVCHTCHKVFSKRRSKLNNSKSGLHFCSRKCKEFAQSIIGGCSEIQPSHYNSGNTYKNSVTKEMIQNGCVDCGEKRDFLLFIHHIDGNRKNNESSNLECVCANHHIIRHLCDTKGKWVYRSSLLTPRDKIIEF